MVGRLVDDLIEKLEKAKTAPPEEVMPFRNIIVPGTPSGNRDGVSSQRDPPSRDALGRSPSDLREKPGEGFGTDGTAPQLDTHSASVEYRIEKPPKKQGGLSILCPELEWTMLRTAAGGR
jgi:hypothetical protein